MHLNIQCRLPLSKQLNPCQVLSRHRTEVYSDIQHPCMVPGRIGVDAALPWFAFAICILPIAALQRLRAVCPSDELCASPVTGVESQE